MKEKQTTYRAVFQQPQKHLNPMRMKLPQKITVEVYPTGKAGTRWKARTIDQANGTTGAIRDAEKHEYTGISANHTQSIVEELFETQCGDWEPFTV